MRWPTKLLKRLAQLVGGLFGLAVVLYLIAVAINWNDAPPSELVREFEASLNNRAAVADEDNAYLAMRDLGGSSDDNFPRIPSESEFAIALYEDCKSNDGYCLDKVAEHQYGAQRWLEEQQWALDRYIAMLQFPAFREPIPDGPTNIISYGDAGYGQRLLMMSAMLSAIDGDQPHVIALLEADLRFWRMVLANSEILITKMVAAAYVRNHFLQGNEVLRVLHKTRWHNTLPLNWLETITEEERSLQRVMIGEWHFGNYYLGPSLTDLANTSYPTDSDASPFAEKIKAIVLQPLYKTQDNKNFNAADLQLVVDKFDVPIQELPASIEAAPGTMTTRPEPYSRIFNAAGDVYLGNDVKTGYRNYFPRTADLEGVRRAAVVVTLMREQQAAREDIDAFLVESEYKNPYTGEPFAWDSEAEAVQFEGLREDRYEVYSLTF